MNARRHAACARERTCGPDNPSMEVTARLPTADIGVKQARVGLGLHFNGLAIVRQRGQPRAFKWSI